MHVLNSKTKTVVVTGGAGFVGSNLVDELVAQGHRVFVIDNLCAGKQENVHPKASLMVGDIRKREDVRKLFQKAGEVDCVFHLAALPRVQFSIQNPVEAAEVNVQALQTLFHEAVQHGVKKVVLTSSSAVYGDTEVVPTHEDVSVNPKSPYALHKYIGERICRLWSEIYGIPTVCLRLFNVYGPKQDPHGPHALVIPKFLAMRKDGKPLTITGDGSQTRDFVHARDVAHAYILAMENNRLKNGEVINVGSGKNVSVKKVAEIIGGEIIYVVPAIEPKHTCADVTRAREFLGWEPTISLEEGIEELKKDLGLFG